MESKLGCIRNHHVPIGMVSVWLLGVDKWVLLTAVFLHSRIKLAGFLQLEYPADENHVLPVLLFSHHLQQLL